MAMAGNVPVPPFRITRREPGVGWVTRNIEMTLLDYEVTKVSTRMRRLRNKMLLGDTDLDPRLKLSIVK